MVIETIRKEFDVTLKARTLRRWLRKIGFSWRKDKYVPSGQSPKRGRGSSKGRSGSVRPRDARTAWPSLSRTRLRSKGPRILPTGGGRPGSASRSDAYEEMPRIGR